MTDELNFLPLKQILYFLDVQFWIHGNLFGINLGLCVKLLKPTMKDLCMAFTPCLSGRIMLRKKAKKYWREENPANELDWLLRKINVRGIYV